MIINELLKKVNLEGKIFRIFVNGIPVNDSVNIYETDELFVIPKISGTSCFLRGSLIRSRERIRLSPRRLTRLGIHNRISPISNDLTELLTEARRLKLKLEKDLLNIEIERNTLLNEIEEVVYRAKESNIKAEDYPINGSEARKGVVNRPPSVPSIVSDEYDYLIKCIVVGDTGVGKTALALQFSKKLSPEDYKTTIGVDFYIKTIPIETKEGPIKAKLQLWVFGDQERFSSIRPMYYRDSLGAVLVFDLTNSSSFEHLPQWIEDVRSNVKSEIPLLLVGNKSDLIDQRQVTLEEINSITRDFNLYYMETSAKTGEGVDNCFYTLTCLILGLELPKRSIDTDKDSKPPRGSPRDPGPAK